ncbi:unnamed protein product [Bursaphelenchus xylophilus]|uniref:(pine wood nematode) hypothetical protein n=1 Tax=Bursaphelenchus xylophilus TaxID=6326 RepID=A0A1I7S8Y7_BURXY|nr:unnamed protein product [Bursaphelenchus xylophilus]CAG9086023.1 unnamed protein product [Bursaphelenchus xylophilus]
MANISGSVPIQKPTLESLSPKPSSVDELPNGVVDVAQTIFQKLGKLMGYSGNCLNNGYKAPNGECLCKQHFFGDRCELVECLNNGTLDRHPDPEQRKCICPSPKYISGRHCEIVSCENGGRDLGNGTCKCIDDWYTGQFCEFYSSSWLAVLGIPLVCLVLIIGCCVFCRADFFSKPREEPEHRRRNRRHSTPRRQQVAVPPNPTSTRPVRPVANPEYNIAPPPTYIEPSNISDIFKTFEPPPSYDMAIQCRVISTTSLPTSNQNALTVQSSASLGVPNTMGDPDISPNLPNNSIVHNRDNADLNSPPNALIPLPLSDLRPNIRQDTDYA